MNKTYCPFPFKEIYSDNNAQFKLCCHSSNSNINVDNPFEFFNSDYMEDIRSRLMSGEQVNECQVCYDMEKHGKRSWRHKAIDHFGFPKNEKVSLKLRIGTNFCNLSCYMCNAKNSSTRTKELNAIYGNTFEFGEPDKVINYHKWNQVIEDILRNIDQVERIVLTGGEPLQLPKQWQLLNMIPDDAAKNIDISITTNLTELSWKSNNLDQIRNKFKDVFVGVSCDHYGEKLSFIRWPINVDKFEKNLIYIKDQGYKNCVKVTVSLLNIDDLHSISEYYRSMGIETEYHAIVNTPKMLSISNLPVQIKNKYLEKYKNEDSIILTELLTEGNQLQNAFKYLDDISAYRKMDWRKLWKDWLKTLEG